jgi:cysteine-rich repeat protein
MDDNGDGVAYIVVGAIGADDGGSARGAVYVLLLDGTPGAFCGDDVLDPGEACDDGNKLNGDCCKSNCTFDVVTTPCDDATVCNGAETCDGAGTCLAGTALNCDDAQPCTQDTCDPTLGCQSTSGPSASCLLPGSTKLDIIDKLDDSKDKIKWKWLKGDATLLADFGDPLGSTQYTLCIYDESAAVPTLTTSLTVPANGAWKPNSKGFKYSDKTLNFDGVRKIGLKLGPAGKAKVDVFAKGANIDPPLVPFDGASFYDQDGKVTVQLINSVGKCWSSDFPVPALKNDVDKFKDKNPQ